MNIHPLAVNRRAETKDFGGEIASFQRRDPNILSGITKTNTFIRHRRASLNHLLPNSDGWIRLHSLLMLALS